MGIFLNTYQKHVGFFSQYYKVHLIKKKKKEQWTSCPSTSGTQHQIPISKDHVFVELYVLLHILQYVYNYSKSKTVKLCSTECYSPEMLFKKNQKGYNCQTNFRNTAQHFVEVTIHLSIKDIWRRWQRNPICFKLT